MVDATRETISFSTLYDTCCCDFYFSVCQTPQFTLVLLCDSVVFRTNSPNFEIISQRRKFFISRCKCGHCSLDFVFKIEECRCSQEIDGCAECLGQANMAPESCITTHPGFSTICLDKWVLEVAAVGLTTKNKKLYTTVFEQGIMTLEEQVKSHPSYRREKLPWRFARQCSRHCATLE